MFKLEIKSFGAPSCWETMICHLSSMVATFCHQVWPRTHLRITCDSGLAPQKPAVSAIVAVVSLCIVFFASVHQQVSIFIAGIPMVVAPSPPTPSPPESAHRLASPWAWTRNLLLPWLGWMARIQAAKAAAQNELSRWHRGSRLEPGSSTCEKHTFHGKFPTFFQTIEVMEIPQPNSPWSHEHRWGPWRYPSTPILGLRFSALFSGNHQRYTIHSKKKCPKISEKAPYPYLGCSSSYKWISIYSIHPSIHPSIYRSIDRSIYLPTYLSS